jgi:hypothetical protein
LPDLLVERGPVHLPAPLHQRVASINKPFQLDSEQFSLRLLDSGFWLHRFSQFFLAWLNLKKTPLKP